MMDLSKLGMPTGNGYPILSFDQRLKLLKEAGFQTLILWWGDDEDISRRERVKLADHYGLETEHAHGSTEALNALWLPGSNGDGTLDRLKKEISDCRAYGIETLVLHLTNGSNPPPVSPEGMRRMAQLVSCAEREKIRLAFENIRLPDHLDAVLSAFSQSEWVGLCYDAGHQHYWSPEKDWLSEQKERVFAIHLHDNFGDRDAHLPPLEGNIQWASLLQKIQQSSYRGSVTLEAEMPKGVISASTDPREVTIHLAEFLKNVHQRGCELASIG